MSDTKPLLLRPVNWVLRLLVWIWRILMGLYRLAIVALVIAAIALFWISWHGPPVATVGRNVALVVRPYGKLVDQVAPSSQGWLEKISGEHPRQTSLRRLRDALADAATDPRIAAVVLNLDDMDSGSLPKLQELARSVDRFRRAGKPVYAYGLSFDQYQYLLASHASNIVLDPMGMVLLQGLAVNRDYFKDALDKLGVQVNVFRVGQFKSAVEPFTRNDMSPEAKLADRAWLNDLWRDYQGDVTKARKLPPTSIAEYINGLGKNLLRQGGDAAQYALKSGLVDAVEKRGAFRRMMEDKVGKDDQTDSFRQVGALAYLRAERAGAIAKPNRIGLIVVQGDIVDGKSGYGTAGGDTIARLLDAARRDKSVSAVVLRVDSPGGSVTAAEEIRRAVQRLKVAGKPVVVSMSTMAASGGYWISMDADRIFAEPTTITGSIGIFGLLPTVDKMLNKIGIHEDGVGTTPLSGAFRIDRPLTQPEKDVIQSEIDFGYRSFVNGVAQGRGLPLATVKEIAQGRVWSGLAAKKLGLIDGFGGLASAIQKAAELAKLARGSYQTKPFVPTQGLFQKIARQFSVQSYFRSYDLLGDGYTATRWLGSFRKVERLLRHFNDPNGEYAYCFCRPDAQPEAR